MILIHNKIKKKLRSYNVLNMWLTFICKVFLNFLVKMICLRFINVLKITLSVSLQRTFKVFQGTSN